MENFLYHSLAEQQYKYYLLNKFKFDRKLFFYILMKKLLEEK